MRRGGAAGFELWQVQSGLAPSDFKPMPAIGAGAYEVRIRVLGEWRMIYVARYRDVVYVYRQIEELK